MQKGVASQIYLSKFCTLGFTFLYVLCRNCTLYKIHLENRLYQSRTGEAAYVQGWLFQGAGTTGRDWAYILSLKTHSNASRVPRLCSWSQVVLLAQRQMEAGYWSWRWVRSLATTGRQDSQVGSRSWILQNTAQNTCEFLHSASRFFTFWYQISLWGEFFPPGKMVEDKATKVKIKRSIVKAKWRGKYISSWHS